LVSGTFQRMLAAGMLFRWTVRRRRMVDALGSREVAL
jgi:hypothetical protein